MFSKKATKIDEIFNVDLTLTTLHNVKSMVKISSIFVAFLENMNFINYFTALNFILIKSKVHIFWEGHRS